MITKLLNWDAEKDENRSIIKNHDKFLIFLSAIFVASPSIILFLVSQGILTSCSDHSVLLSEKVWIYYVEFIRNADLGLYNWPSLSDKFEGYIYIERIIPRLIYWPIKFAPELYFLLDAIYLFTGFILFILFINKYISYLKIKPGTLAVVLSCLSLYIFRLFFIEGLIPESWFSRNLVAMLALASGLFLIDKNKSISSKAIILTFIFFIHTYTFMLLYGYCMINQLFQPRRSFKFIFYGLFLGFVFLLLNFINSTNTGFIEFSQYYGVLETRQFDFFSNAKYIIIILISYIFAEKIYKYEILKIGAVALLLINLYIITGFRPQDIHYRIYFLEWLAMLLIFNRLSIFNFNFKRISTAFLLLYLSLYYNEQSEKFSVNKTEDIDKGMVVELLNMDKKDLISFELIWDSPNIEQARNNWTNIYSSSCSPGNWYSCIIHLNKKNKIEKKSK